MVLTWPCNCSILIPQNRLRSLAQDPCEMEPSYSHFTDRGLRHRGYVYTAFWNKPPSQVYTIALAV